MIERKFIKDNIKEFQVKEFVKENVGRVGLSDVKIQRTPLGEKIIIAASRPGLVVGRSGANITKMTKMLKKEFSLENPQIEIEEIKQIGLDANIIAELIGGSLERYGSARFKAIGHKAMTDVINSGAVGIEIIISGKIPSSRAKNWRFYQGYLKKCGDISISGVDKAYSIAKLKTGIVGIKVSIMPPTTKLPDKIELLPEPQEIIEELKEKESEQTETEIKKQTAQETAIKETEKTLKKESEEKTKKETKAKSKKQKEEKEEKKESKKGEKTKNQ